MNDKEISRNGSGYYDPTAYKAIKKYIKSEEKNMEIFKGDIVEIEMNNGFTREAVILAVHDNYSTVLMLCDNDSLPCSVNCKGKKYTDPGMVQYAFNDNIKGLIRSMKQAEIDDLIREVVNALGYEPLVDGIVKEVTQEPVEYTDEVLQCMVEAEALKVELTKAQAERDVFKSLYENLIGSMIAK